MESLKLKSIGYRELKNGKWLKPVGFSLFTYNEDERLWSCVFRSASDGKSVTWSYESIDEDLNEFVNTILYHESCSRIDTNPNMDRENFSFNTNEEIIESML